FSIDVTPSSARQPAKCLLALRRTISLDHAKANDNNSYYFLTKKHFVYFRGGAQECQTALFRIMA
ncbi:hypothetical protein, partial [Klebsiella aerogenes]|uniref:hypothetical protein n=1 Tax=Klebsiella aerogenes TaxID=548 RepID=UPI00197A9180